MVTDNSEVEFSLDGASHYEKPPADGGGDGAAVEMMVVRHLSHVMRRSRFSRLRLTA